MGERTIVNRFINQLITGGAHIVRICNDMWGCVDPKKSTLFAPSMGTRALGLIAM